MNDRTSPTTTAAASPTRLGRRRPGTGTRRPRRARLRTAAALAPLALVLLAAATPAAAGDAASSKLGAGSPTPAPGSGDPLTLRISDAVAEPGGLASVVIRTYSSRPVGRGQLDFVAASRAAAAQSLGSSLLDVVAAGGGGGGSLAPYLTGHVVFSSNGDVQSVIDPDTMQVAFLSPSGSVNDLDGPLAALFFRLPGDLTPGTEFDLTLAGGTYLIDEDGEQVPVEFEPGVLTVRAHGDPRLVAADGDRVEPGETAELGIETFEPFALTAGRVVLHYDPAIAAGPPLIRFDRRHGRASFTADVSTPGTIVVDFAAPEGSLNRLVPGSLIQVALPISSAVPPGTLSPLEIDRERTWLETLGFAGTPPFEFTDDEIEVE